MRNLSLRLRLILLIGLSMFITWLIASTVNYFQIRHNLEEVFDSQQLLFAKRLASFDLHNLVVQKKPVQLPEIDSKALKSLKFDDDALAFAIFNLNGEMLLNDGEDGKDFRFTTEIINNKDGTLLTNTKEWRILWLRSFDGGYIVAVGQELDFREDLSQELIIAQIFPWLLVLPILMVIIAIAISRELKPLRVIATRLMLREPDDSSVISKEGAPKEVVPFIDALNALFVRISGMLVKERSFISDAAHELRTPLAALKVQTEVVQLSDDDPESRRHALANLMTGIDRAGRLIDQLLTLSRLQASSKVSDVERVQWPELVRSVVQDLSYQAQRRNAEIEVHQRGVSTFQQGNVLLLSLMIRNLIDNALRYTPQGSRIDITLFADKLTIEDNGPGVSQDNLIRLGERFFRPPGQDEIGSGLGLSIVKQIADAHKMKVRFYNLTDGGFGVEIRW